MIAVPSPAYAKSLAGVTPREILTASENDMIITPQLVEEPFKRYICSILDINPNKIITLSPKGEPTDMLAHSVRRNGMVDQLREFVSKNPDADFLCFAIDAPTFELVEELGIALHGYRVLPNQTLRDTIYQLNTKSGFRQVAEEIGLRIVPGMYCKGLDSLSTAVKQLMDITGGVLVKYNRSSNGYGQIILRREEMLNLNLREYLYEQTALYPEQPHIFTVEALMKFTNVPSVEIDVDDTGSQVLYLCDMRCPNGKFAGMVTPPLELIPEIKQELMDVGEKYGNYLYRIGFRGVCDVDTGVTADGALYVTETNLRRTGGTYLDILMHRLFGENYLETHIWVADARVGGINQDFFGGLSAIKTAGLAFDPVEGKGVILTADTLQIDGKWRYLIIAPTARLIKAIGVSETTNIIISLTDAQKIKEIDEKAKLLTNCKVAVAID